MADNSILIELMTDSQELEQILLRERNVLLGPHTTSAGEIAVIKNKLIDSIELRMADYLKSSGGEILNVTEVSQLTTILTRCKELNSDNNALVNQRLNTVRQSISVIRNATNSDNLQLYTEQGKPSPSSMSRALADA